MDQQGRSRVILRARSRKKRKGKGKKKEQLNVVKPNQSSKRGCEAVEEPQLKRQRPASNPTVQVNIELGHRAGLRKKTTRAGHTHDWSVFVRGAEGSNIHHYVAKVVFNLPNSYPNPTRTVSQPPYRVSETGHADFNMAVEIHFKNKEEPRTIVYHYDLFLHGDGMPAVDHVRCETVTFEKPAEEFRRRLLKAGGITFRSSCANVDTDTNNQLVTSNAATIASDGNINLSTGDKEGYIDNFISIQPSIESDNALAAVTSKVASDKPTRYVPPHRRKWNKSGVLTPAKKHAVMSDAISDITPSTIIPVPTPATCISSATEPFYLPTRSSAALVASGSKCVAPAAPAAGATHLEPRVPASESTVPLYKPPSQRTLYVGNLTSVINNDDVKTYFGQFGNVVAIRRHRSRYHFSKFFAFVSFSEMRVDSIQETFGPHLINDVNVYADRVKPSSIYLSSAGGNPTSEVQVSSYTAAQSSKTTNHLQTDKHQSLLSFFTSESDVIPGGALPGITSDAKNGNREPSEPTTAEPEKCGYDFSQFGSWLQQGFQFGGRGFGLGAESNMPDLRVDNKPVITGKLTWAGWKTDDIYQTDNGIISAISSPVCETPLERNETSTRACMSPFKDRGSVNFGALPVPSPIVGFSSPVRQSVLGKRVASPFKQVHAGQAENYTSPFKRANVMLETGALLDSDLTLLSADASRCGSHNFPIINGDPLCGSPFKIGKLVQGIRCASPSMQLKFVEEAGCRSPLKEVNLMNRVQFRSPFKCKSPLKGVNFDV